MLSIPLLNKLAESFAFVLPKRASQAAAQLVFGCMFRLFGRKHLKLAAFAVRLTLAEPQAQAQKIALRCFRAKGRQRNNYRLMSRVAQWPEARTEFSAQAHRALAETNQPLVLLTLHQADYLAGLLTVLKLIPLEREIHIIKLAEWTRIEEDAYQHFRQFGHTLVIHRLNDRPAKRIVRALKQHAILVTFVDVPREYGSTVGVTMFDLPFQLTSGPLAMARLAGAQVLPLFSSYADNDQRVVNAGPLIRTDDPAPQNRRKRSIAAMAQDLADQIETNLRRHGDQWEMWPVIPNLLDQERLASIGSQLPPNALARLTALGATFTQSAPPPSDETET